MKHFFLFLFLFFSVFSLHAEKLYENGFWYSVTNGSATITRISWELPDNLVVPSRLGGFSVTEIADYALWSGGNFRSISISEGIKKIGCIGWDCQRLEKIIIPSSVTEIVSNAFSYCPNVSIQVDPKNSFYESVQGSLVSRTDKSLLFASIPKGTYTYSVPFGVSKICGDALSLRDSLRMLSIPSTVTNISDKAFLNCSSLKIMVDLENPVYVSMNGSLYDKGKKRLIRGASSLIPYSFEIPENVIEIASYAFSMCRRMTSISFPSGVKKVGESAFLGCSSLRYNVSPNNPFFLSKDGSLLDKMGRFLIYGAGSSSPYSYSIPEGVCFIGDNAFSGSPFLTSVSLPEGVESIGSGAFSHCSRLSSINLPDSITNIAKEAFACCKTLESVVLPSTLTEIEDEVFSECSALTSIYFPKNLKRLGKGAFKWCSFLDYVQIPDGVTNICESAFEGCLSLRNLQLPKNLQVIGESAFDGCDLTFGLKIPSKVVEIGGWAFYNCDFQMDGYVFQGEPPPKIGKYAFTDTYITDFVIFGYYPQSKTDIWKAQIKNGYWEGLKMKSWNDEVQVPSESESLYRYQINMDEATITGFDKSYKGEVNIPTHLGGYPVTAIGEDAFKGCMDINSVKIPSGVIYIGDRAFFGCVNAVSFTIPSTVSYIGYATFSGCQSLSSIHLPNELTHIGDSSFERCKKLSTISIPWGVDTIGPYAFSGCESLDTINIPWKVEAIQDRTFLGCRKLNRLYIPRQISSIDPSAFGDCPLLRLDVDAQNPNYMSIDGSLYGRSGKKLIWARSETYPYTFVIPYGVTSIENSAFSGCSNMERISIPEGVTNIGDSVFCGCYSLKSLTIPQSVKSLGVSSIEDVNTIKINSNELLLKGISWDNRKNRQIIFAGDPPNYEFPLDYYFFNSIGYYPRVKSEEWGLVIDSQGKWFGMPMIPYDPCPPELEKCFTYSIFEGHAIITAFDRNYSGELSVPQILDKYPVVAIGDYAFAGCRNLTSVTIPEGITEIGNSAFGGCENLHLVTIPDSVITIGGRAFTRCRSMTTVTIPQNVISVSDEAFSECENLSLVLFEGGFPPEMGKNVFSGTVAGLEILYPRDKYRPWTYANDMTEIWTPFDLKPYDYVPAEIRALFTYSISNGEASVIGLDHSCSGAVAIPVLLGGARVTTLLPYSLSGCYGLTSVAIPASVQSIGYSTFSGSRNLFEINFRGAPPRDVGADAFWDTAPGITGSYPSQEREAWEKEIDSTGCWHGLIMRQPSPLFTLPLPDQTKIWLSSQLGEQGITSGTVSFHPNTTVETLDAARILGIVPSVTQSGGDVSVAAGGKLETVDLTVTGETVTLTIKVTASAGTLPIPYRPAGDLVLLGYESLDGEGIPLTPVESSGWRSNTKGEAVITLTYEKTNSHFFRYLLQ